jgi:TatD DNase family protein
MNFTDTHTHLYSEEFDLDRDFIIQNAIKNGVSKFYVPSIDSTYTQKMYDLEAQYPENIKLMMGLHPCYVKENYKEELAHVEIELSKRPFAAIGEIGIDLFWDKTFLKEQQEAFATQINWAKKLELPINIHCRDAFDEIFEILEQEKSKELWGIFHCFTGNESQAWQAIECGMKLGIGGVVTFKNGKIDQFLHNIPIEHVVLETDSPYLAPVPYRGKRNESAYVKLVAEKLAAIYNKELDEIAEITAKNADSVFK